MKKIPVTQATRFLKGKSIDFEAHSYSYKDKGGTKETAIQLKVDEHNVVKTLVFDNDSGIPFIVLMHGDKEVSTKEIGRITGNKKVFPCDMKKAQRLTGYIFGGTSPFGLKTDLKIYIEESILECKSIFINGGKQGFILEISAETFEKSIEFTKISVAI